MLKLKKDEIIKFNLEGKEYELLEEYNNFFKGATYSSLSEELALVLHTNTYKLLVCKNKKDYLSAKSGIDFLSCPYIVAYHVEQIVLIVPYFPLQHNTQES